MSRSGKFVAAASLFFFLAGLKAAVGQKPIPEFFIAVAPSVVTIHQGDISSLTVTIKCNDSSLIAATDCNAWPKFDLHLSEFPDGTQAEMAAGRVGANTVAISASSKAKAGSFAIKVTVVAGNTTQEQTFLLSVRQSASSPPAHRETQPPVDATASPGSSWEHHVLVAKTPEEFNRMADDLGRDSWELVSVIAKQDAGFAEWIGFFKRQKR